MSLLHKLKQKIFRTPEMPKGLFGITLKRKIPELPALTNQNITYGVIGDVLQAQIKSKFYSIKEPELNVAEKDYLEIIKNGVFEIINYAEQEDPGIYIEKIARIVISELDIRINEESLKKILYYIYRDLIGLGKIEPLLRDELISQIYYQKTLRIRHKIYGVLQTDILLKDEELLNILRKLALMCNKELPSKKFSLQLEKGELNILIKHNPQLVSDSTFNIHKSTAQRPGPLELLGANKLSAEILAYLWITLEAKQDIYIMQDSNITNALSYFLPFHSKIITNIPNYTINKNTITFIGVNAEQEDYAITQNLKKGDFKGTFISSTANPQEEQNIVIYTDRGTITTIRENGKDIFSITQKGYTKQFENSEILKSKGNLAILEEELKTRAKLCAVLYKNNTKHDDFKKIINIYIQNPTAILQRAGIQ